MYPPRVPMYPVAPLLAASEGAPPWPDGRDPRGDRRPGGGANCMPGATGPLGCLGGDHWGGGVMRPRAGGGGGSPTPVPYAFDCPFDCVFGIERPVFDRPAGVPGAPRESPEGPPCCAASRASAASIRACSSGSISQLLSESVSVSAPPPPPPPRPRPRPRPPQPAAVAGTDVRERPGEAPI